MEQRIVMAFVGADRPGLVDRISRVIADHGGNWQEGRLSRLAGQFAGILEIAVEAAHADELAAALLALGDEGLSVLCVPCDASPPLPEARAETLHILGHDRRGIVSDVARALAEREISVSEMSSSIFTAPMSGEAMFLAQAVVLVPLTVDLGQLEEALDAVSQRLGVDIDLGDEED